MAKKRAKKRASGGNCKRITFKKRGKSVVVTRCKSHVGGLKKAAKARYAAAKRAKKVCRAKKAPRGYPTLRPFVACK
jgi:hypothetical protein